MFRAGSVTLGVLPIFVVTAAVAAGVSTLGSSVLDARSAPSGLASWTIQVDTTEEPSDEQVARGKFVFDNICSECHSLEPLMLKAPPFTHVGRHVRAVHPTLAAFMSHVRTYLPAPSEDKALMPAMAIERFGLMPPQPLPENMLNDVAAYLWSISEPAEESGGRPSGTPAG